MAAPQVSSIDQEASPSQLHVLLEFAKYQKENPGLDTDQVAKRFLGVSHTPSHNSSHNSSQNSPQNPPETTIQRSSAIQIRRDFASPTLSKPGSCPQTSNMPPLGGSQLMARGNSHNQASPQHAFALRAGRSPQQFANTVPVATFSSSFPETLRTNVHQYATGPPSFQALQSLGVDSAPALQEYLNQNNKHEPFPLAARDSGFGETRTNKGYPSLTIDPTLEGFSAPQMRSQLSSSASDFFNGGDELFLDSPHSLSYPMNRSHSQTESASPTEPFVFGQHGESNPMSRQASGTSFIHGGLSMLRVQSSTGSSGNANDTIGGMYGVSNDDVDNLLSGIGDFATESGDDPSSINKASAQVVLKRSSSVSVDDLNDSMAVAEGQAEHYSSPTGPGGQPKSRKQRRVKGEKEEEEEKEEEADFLRQKNTSTAKQPGTKAKPETTTRTNARPTKSGQPERKRRGSGSARPLPTIKPGKNPNSPPLATSKSCYVRPPRLRVHCNQCSAHPDGFRGDHELRRHTDREHAPRRKMYVIKDISEGGTRLANCKACKSGKKYGVDYNAAAHLRRQHFKLPGQNGKSKQKVTPSNSYVPEMGELRKWIVEVEVEVPISTNRLPRESGDNTHPNAEDEEDTSEEEETKDASYQEIEIHKNQQDTLELMQDIEQELDMAVGQPQTDVSWTSNKWIGSTVNNATYTLSNQKMPQYLTHQLGSHVSATTGSVPLIGGGLNQQNIAIHLPAQHQMVMQGNHHLQQLHYFTNGTCNTACFGECLPITSTRVAKFNDDPYDFLISEADMKPI